MLVKKTTIPLPELNLIAATRGMLGAGIALIVSSRISEARRKTVGWSLIAVGALSTLPLAYSVYKGINR